MNLVTICTQNWVSPHLERWLYYANKYMPKAWRYLIYAGDDIHLDGFDAVKCSPAKVADRPWFNSIRMSAATIFNIPDFLYTDVDVDIMSDLSGVEDIKGDVLWARSPVVHPEWSEAANALNLIDEPEANNGLFYMRGDMSEQYNIAAKEVDELGVHPRIRGTMIFNVMLQRGISNAELNPDFHRIWWETEHLLTAKTIHYCNDSGQSKRVNLEKIRSSII